MKKILIITAVVAQLAALAWMGFEREWVVRTGQTVYLRTAPVDPRDPMRGDYVRLNYEIAAIPKALCQGNVASWFRGNEYIYSAKVRDRRVFAALELDVEGVANVTSVSDLPPSEGLYLRGRATAIRSGTLDVRFGVEAFFMEQGEALKFENTVREEKAGVPLNMQVAVGKNGMAVLKGYRWEPLGMTIDLERDRQEGGASSPQVTQPSNASVPRDQSTRGLRGLTVEIKNHSGTPQTIVIGPTLGTLRLESTQTEDQTGWVWVGRDVPASKPQSSDVKVLQPGESHRQRIDFTEPQWFVRKREPEQELGPAVSIATLSGEWTASFRVEYAPVSQAESLGLPGAQWIRHTRLKSRRFFASGDAD